MQSQISGTDPFANSSASSIYEHSRKIPIVLYRLATEYPPNMVSTTRVALVTGAARGIGRAIALRLAEDGFDVAVNDLPNTPELNDVLQGIQSKGRRSIAVPADVSLEPEVVRMIQDIVQELGSLDVVGPFRRLAAKRAEAYHRWLRTRA